MMGFSYYSQASKTISSGFKTWAEDAKFHWRKINIWTWFMFKKNGFLPLGQDIQVPFHKAGIMSKTSYQWPFQDPKLEVPTIYKAYFSGLCKGISP